MPGDAKAEAHDSFRGEGRAKMLRLITRGLVKAGQEIFFQYKREFYMAVVDKSGELSVLNGKRYETPSEFANDMVKRYNTEHRIRVRGSVNVNGWQHCTVSDHTLQQLLDLPEIAVPADQHASSQLSDDFELGERKRKRGTSDPYQTSRDDAAPVRSLRKRRTTRLAAGKIKQVDYKFPAGGSGEAVNGGASRNSVADSEVDSSADDENNEGSGNPSQEHPDATKEEPDPLTQESNDKSTEKQAADVQRPVTDSSQDAESVTDADQLKGTGTGEEADPAVDGDPFAGWDLEEQEVLLDWLQTKGVLDAEVLAEESLGRASDDIKRYLDGIIERMREAGIDECDDVEVVTAFLAAEVSLGRAARAATKEKKAQRRGRVNRELAGLKKKIEEERNRSNELVKTSKKHKRELEEARSRLESEMVARRELELERSHLRLQISDFRAQQKTEADLCEQYRLGGDELRQREAEARNQLEKSRIRIEAMKSSLEALQGPQKVANARINLEVDESAALRRSPAGSAPSEVGALQPLTATNRDPSPVLWEQARSETARSLKHQELRTGNSAQTSAGWQQVPRLGAPQGNLEKIQMDIRRLKAYSATLDAEIDDWKAHVLAEQRQYRYIQECKVRLDHALRLARMAAGAKKPSPGPAVMAPPQASKPARPKHRGGSLQGPSALGTLQAPSKKQAQSNRGSVGKAIAVGGGKAEHQAGTN